LPPTIGLEQILVRLVHSSVDLDRELLLLEGDIDVEQLTVHAHWQIGLPAFDPSRTQQPVTQTLGSRPRLTPRVDQELQSFPIARSVRS
jgi:hypothetical protein